MEIPKETELVSFFGFKPIRKDESEALFYDTATFSFDNEEEQIELIISPFYDKFVLKVQDKKTDDTKAFIELRSVQRLELVYGDSPKIRLVHGESDIYQNILEFTFNPRFKMLFEEQYR